MIPSIATEPDRRNKLFWGAAGLLGLCAVAFFPTFFNHFIWDDDRYITLNNELLTLHGLMRIWLVIGAVPQYYPLTHTTFWIEYHLWGIAPYGYHIDNLLLHAASATMLWRILRRLSIPGAFLAALLWAIHPLQAESVGWATERKNILSGFLYILSLWCYLRRSESARWYVISLIAFIASLLSKSVTSSLPAVILLLSWWKTGRITWRDIWPVIPMFILGIAMGALTGWMEKNIVGAVGPAFDFSQLDRVCIAGRAVWFYLAKLFYPANLIFIYPRWTIDPRHRPWLILFPSAWAACLFALWMLRNHIGRGPLTAALVFCGSLFPALGFVNVYPMQFSFVADHFQYLAGIGPIVLIVAVLRSRFSLTLLSILISPVVAVFCILSILHLRTFYDAGTLWSEVIRQNPNSEIAHNDLGEYLLGVGDYDRARIEARKAIELAPRSPWGGYILLGRCDYLEENYQGAMENYQKALANWPDSNEPQLHAARFLAYFEIGTAYGALADHASGQPTADHYRALGIEAYQTAIALNPRYEPALTNYAVMLTAAKLYDRAIEQCDTVLNLNPQSVPAWTNLGNVYFLKGQLDQAANAYQKCLAIQPSSLFAITNLGHVYLAQKKWDQAMAAFQSALAIDPANASAAKGLSDAIIARGENR